MRHPAMLRPTAKVIPHTVLQYGTPTRPRLFKDALWRSLTEREELSIVDTATGVHHRGIVNTIQAEGGRGCFIVTLHTGAHLFHRTAD